MKNSYLKLMKVLIFLTILLTTPSFSQSSADDSFSRLFELMEERIQKAFGDFFTDDENLNQMFDLGQDIFKKSPFGSMFKQDLEYEWIQEAKGRTLVVKVPENNKLDINIKNKMILITGEIKSTKETKTQHGSSKSVSISSVSEGLPIPLDCDGSKVKQSSKKLDEKLVTRVFFPYKTGKPGDPGQLARQKSFDMSDITKSLPKNLPGHTRKSKTHKKNNKTEVREDEMIPLFEDGDGI